MSTFNLLNLLLFQKPLDAATHEASCRQWMNSALTDCVFRKNFSDI